MTHLTNGSKKSTTDNLAIEKLIVEFITINIPRLNRSKKHSAEDLIGSDIWETLEIGVRHEIGEVIYELVKCRSLPITYAGKTSSNKHTYWIA